MRLHVGTAFHMTKDSNLLKPWGVTLIGRYSGDHVNGLRRESRGKISPQVSPYCKVKTRASDPGQLGDDVVLNLVID